MPSLRIDLSIIVMIWEISLLASALRQAGRSCLFMYAVLCVESFTKLSLVWHNAKSLGHVGNAKLATVVSFYEISLLFFYDDLNQKKPSSVKKNL